MQRCACVTVTGSLGLHTRQASQTGDKYLDLVLLLALSTQISAINGDRLLYADGQNKRAIIWTKDNAKMSCYVPNMVQAAADISSRWSQFYKTEVTSGSTGNEYHQFENGGIYN